MGAIFQSLGRTIIAGIVLVLILLGAAGTFGRMGGEDYWAFFFRWLHILSGVMWIGLLWYFNFVQIPSMPNRVPVPNWLSKFVAFNLPWPKGTPTPPDLVAVDHFAFDEERQRCLTLIDAFTARDLNETWTPSASFGRLTGREWSRFQAKHLDHHLRQFGV